MLLSKQEKVQKEILLWNGKAVPVYATKEALRDENPGINLPATISQFQWLFLSEHNMSKINPPKVQAKKPPLSSMPQ